MIGRTLGHFRILEKIGSGGMGEVYRARDQHLDRDVAVKVLPAGTLADDAARKRFRQEALTLSKLNHPNIATVHDFVSEPQADFLVMECVSGVTLSDRLASGPMPEKDILTLGAQLAEGLAAAHEQGVIHCDLKPGNLRVTPDGRLKVLDFGLARFLGPAGDSLPTQTESLLRDAAGTLPYMAPEQLSGSPPDTRSDLYAAGAVLYEMATGQRMFPLEREPQRQLAAILHQVPRAPSALNPHISPGLEGVILKCLEKDPDHRYQSAREIVADLRRLGASTSLINVTAASSGRRPRKPLLAALLAAAVAVSAAAGWWFVRSRADSRAVIHSLAVLPFTSLSHDPEQEYLVDGMTDWLITDLGQMGALRVISRTSVMQYRGGDKKLGEIARELQVDGIVEGSVWRSGNRTRITARLVYAPTDTQVWSKSYESNVSDALDLQGQLAAAIINKIQGGPAGKEPPRPGGRGPANPEAQEAYLRGSYLLRGTYEQRRLAGQYFERAVQLDPQYAAAYAGLAEYYSSNLEMPATEAIRKAKEAAQTALRLDPGLAQAHRAAGNILYYGDWDRAGAEKEFKEALRLNPSDAEAHRTYSMFLSAESDTGGAIQQIQTAQSLDPLFLASRITGGWVYYYARRYPEAIEQCQKALELDSKSVGAQECLGSARLMLGATEQAIEHCRLAVEWSGGDASRLAELGRAYARAGKTAEARQVLARLEASTRKSYVPPYLIALVYAALGEQQPTLNWLDRAFSEHDRYMVWLGVDPAFDFIREQPRFQELLKRLGLGHS